MHGGSVDFGDLVFPSVKGQGGGLSLPLSDFWEMAPPKVSNCKRYAGMAEKCIIIQPNPDFLSAWERARTTILSTPPPLKIKSLALAPRPFLN